MTRLTANRPVFRTLSDAQCRAILGRNHVGRLCFLNHGAVDIEPVHYASAGGWVFIRSANGTKIEALAHTPYVAFEVDEIDAAFDWRSVVARGTSYFMDNDGPPVERQTFDRAVRALRSFVPETLTAGDPTPFRQTIYGIHVDLLTGRSAATGPRRSKRGAVPVKTSRTPVRRGRDGF